MPAAETTREHPWKRGIRSVREESVKCDFLMSCRPTLFHHLPCPAPPLLALHAACMCGSNANSMGQVCLQIYIHTHPFGTYTHTQRSYGGCALARDLRACAPLYCCFLSLTETEQAPFRNLLRNRKRDKNKGEHPRASITRRLVGIRSVREESVKCDFLISCRPTLFHHLPCPAPPLLALHAACMCGSNANSMGQVCLQIYIHTHPFGTYTHTQRSYGGCALARDLRACAPLYCCFLSLTETEQAPFRNLLRNRKRDKNKGEHPRASITRRLVGIRSVREESVKCDFLISCRPTLFHHLPCPASPLLALHAACLTTVLLH